VANPSFNGSTGWLIADHLVSDQYPTAGALAQSCHNLRKLALTVARHTGNAQDLTRANLQR
jgi:hypothetical protein